MVVAGLVASLVAGLATGIGALPVLVLKGGVSRRCLDGMLGLAAGVMLAATAFSLLVPALEGGGVIPAGGGLLLGAALIAWLDRHVPHTHFQAGREGPSSRLARVWLLILAITIHNFPEGMSVGVVFGSGDPAAGVVLAAAIGLQNMPEGLAVAAPLVREGYKHSRAVCYAALTGLVEPIAGFLGAALVRLAAGILPWALGFAAGAMLYVVSDEMIPESHREGHQREATWGVVLGFFLMMVLDNVLG
ncbi:MAG: ZIP family metal transporter [Firmicutes bacterium]|nr:ZIP family metal transporter [Candidatus Fermentithermobacillaceae bacterium]